MTCPVCGEPGQKPSMCRACQVSYDRRIRTDDGTVMGVLVWAAARARKFERRRARQALQVVSAALAMRFALGLSLSKLWEFGRPKDGAT